MIAIPMGVKLFRPSEADGVHRGDIQQTFDHLGFLGAGDGMHAINNEAGHAVDAQPVGPKVVGVNASVSASEARKRRTARRVHAAGGGNRGQDGVVADVVAHR